MIKIKDDEALTKNNDNSSLSEKVIRETIEKLILKKEVDPEIIKMKDFLKFLAKKLKVPTVRHKREFVKATIKEVLNEMDSDTNEDNEDNEKTCDNNSRSTSSVAIATTIVTVTPTTTASLISSTTDKRTSSRKTHTAKQQRLRQSHTHTYNHTHNHNHNQATRGTRTGFEVEESHTQFQQKAPSRANFSEQLGKYQPAWRTTATAEPDLSDNLPQKQSHGATKSQKMSDNKKVKSNRAQLLSLENKGKINHLQQKERSALHRDEVSLSTDDKDITTSYSSVSSIDTQQDPLNFQDWLSSQEDDSSLDTSDFFYDKTCNSPHSAKRTRRPKNRLTREAILPSRANEDKKSSKCGEPRVKKKTKVLSDKYGSGDASKNNNTNDAISEREEDFSEEEDEWEKITIMSSTTRRSLPSSDNNSSNRWIKDGALFHGIIDHKVQEHKVKIAWNGHKQAVTSTWKRVMDIQRSEGLQIVLDYLEGVKNSVLNPEGKRNIIKWIEHIKTFQLELINDTASSEEHAFCCAHCCCSANHCEKLYSLFGPPRSSSCGPSGVFHRWCCHNVTNVNDVTWQSPLQTAIEKGFSGGQTKSKPHSLIGYASLQRKIDAATNKEKSEMNKILDGEINADSKLYTSESYMKYCKIFHRVLKKSSSDPDKRPEPVVLDVFGGIGSGTIVLKRLQIKMQKIIHIELDSIAQYVVQKNHEDKSDGIEHVYISKFETILDDIDAFMEDHGPIDVILGGPPCSDHSKVNGQRKGIKGLSGKLLVTFGQFISEVMKHPRQMRRPVHFLSENVIINNFDELEALAEAYSGVPHITIDAAQFSPCARKRSYWLSLPISNLEAAGNLMRDASSASCLENGWMIPVHALQGVSLPSKANTFMASKSRQDDDRMLKIRKVECENDEEDVFECSVFSVAEREMMLGLPKGYVENAVTNLFAEFDKAMLVEQTNSQVNVYWKGVIDEKYYHFAERKFKIRAKTEPPYFELRVCIPMEIGRKREVFLTPQEYCKRLLGNGWSIPVIEFLLKPLKDIFANKVYQGYNYKYPWELFEV